MNVLPRILAGLVFVLLCSVGCRCQTSGSAGPFLPMAKAGPEVWRVDASEYRVAATYYLALPKGLQYTIDYRVPDEVKVEGMTEAAAYDLAFPLMRYAYEHESYKRAVIKRSGTDEQQVALIGVSLFKGNFGYTKGYRVSRALSDIKARIGAGG